MTSEGCAPKPEWLAGFFDGEGSVGLYATGGTGKSLRVQIAQAETPQSIRLFGLLVDSYSGSLSVMQMGSGRRALHFQLNGDKATRFLREIATHLCLKRDQVDLVLEYAERKPPRQRNDRGHVQPHTPEWIAYANSVAAELKRMKRAR